MKFKNYIETESGIKDTSTSPGAAGQVLSSTVSGTSWIDQSTLVSGSAERVSILVKNGEGTALVKGDPVYIIGSVGASARLEVGLCDASDPSKMPCVGLLEQDLLNNGEGTAVTAGKLRNLITTPIDGQPTTENDTIYVKAGGSSGLALTTTKPTGSTNLIQNVGQVGRVSASSDGNFVVSAIMRTNDVPNLPTGKIWVGDGNTTVSTVVHLDETNGRMGVGTNSPGATFHVSGGAIRIDDAQQLQFGNGNVNIRNDASGRMYLRAPLAYFFEGNGGYKMVLDGNSGNLGIGTTSPSSQLGSTKVLDISSTGNGEIILDHTDAGTSSDIGLYSWNRNNDHLAHIKASCDGATDSAFISFHAQPTGGSFSNAASNEKMRIKSNGNVGIGTTSPNHELVVQGTSNPNIELKNSNYSNGGFILNRTNYGHQWKWWAESNVMYFGFSTDESTYSTKLAIESSGDVGIGTTSPAQKLHVVGNSEITGDIYLGRYIFHDNDTNTWLGFPLADTISFRTNGSDRMYINSSGNVGIGTTSPSYKLDVAGDLRVDNGNVGPTSGDEVEHIKVQGARHFLKFKEVRTADDSEWKNTTFKLQAGVDSTNHQSIDFVADGSYNEHIDIRTGNQVFNTRFTYDGNVGVGTTNPAKKLTIGNIGIGNTDGLKIEDPSNTAYGAHYSFDDTNSTVEIGGITNNVLNDCISIARDATRAITINALENVGIGATSPSYKLDVNGTGRFTNTLYYSSLVQQSQADTKKDIANIDKNKATAIPFKQYKYKTGDTERVRYGVVVEDIEQYYPELVHIGEDGIKGVSYIDLLVKRVAELEKELEEISLTPGPKGDKGDAGSQGSAGANGTNGKNGVNGNDHLKNVKSITFNEKSGQLEITIEGYKELFRFNLAK